MSDQTTEKRELSPGACLTDWKKHGRLLEGELDDIREEVCRVLGDDADAWLQERNIRFGGKTPSQVIDDGEEFWLRDVLRSQLMGGGG